MNAIEKIEKIKAQQRARAKVFYDLNKVKILEGKKQKRLADKANKAGKKIEIIETVQPKIIIKICFKCYKCGKNIGSYIEGKDNTNNCFFDCKTNMLFPDDIWNEIKSFVGIHRYYPILFPALLDIVNQKDLEICIAELTCITEKQYRLYVDYQRSSNREKIRKKYKSKSSEKYKFDAIKFMYKFLDNDITIYELYYNVVETQLNLLKFYVEMNDISKKRKKEALIELQQFKLKFC